VAYGSDVGSGPAHSIVKKGIGYRPVQASAGAVGGGAAKLAGPVNEAASLALARRIALLSAPVGV